MSSHIIVALEGAEAFAAVPPCSLDCAGMIAARTQADIAIVHVEPPLTSELDGFTPYQYEGIVQAAARELRGRIARTRHEVGTLGQRVVERWSVHADATLAAGPLRETTERLARGSPGELLLARAGDDACRAGYLAALPPGVVDDLEIPVLFLRAGTCALLENLERILVVLDGSSQAERMLGLARRLLPPQGGGLHLLLVQSARGGYFWRGRSANLTSRPAAERYLESITGRSELADVALAWSVAGAEAGSPLRDVAGRTRANLVALTVRGSFAATLAGLREPRLLQDLPFPLLAWSARGKAPTHSSAAGD